MAAKTASTVRQYSISGARLLKVTFTDIDDDDTYASGLSGVLGQWANRSDDPTQTKEGVGVSESGGTFTFYTGEDNCAVDLFILTT